jgi:hypothetical protein
VSLTPPVSSRNSTPGVAGAAFVALLVAAAVAPGSFENRF